MKIQLTEHEILFCNTSPEVLRMIAEYHSSKEAMADAMGYYNSANFHETRREELHEAADEFEEEYEL